MVGFEEIRNVPSRVKVNGTFSDDFTVLEALYTKIRPEFLEELLYNNDLVLISETRDGLK